MCGIVSSCAHLCVLVPPCAILCILVRSCATLCDLVHPCAILCRLVRSCASLCDLVRSCAILCHLVRSCAILCRLVPSCAGFWIPGWFCSRAARKPEANAITCGAPRKRKNAVSIDFQCILGFMFAGAGFRCQILDSRLVLLSGGYESNRKSYCWRSRPKTKSAWDLESGTGIQHQQT